MIEVRLRYFETNDELFSDRERIGFWTWEQFVQWFNRLHSWRIKFELEEINGSDFYTGHDYNSAPIYINPPTALHVLFFAQGRSRPEYDAKALVMLLNDRIRRDYP